MKPDEVQEWIVALLPPSLLIARFTLLISRHWFVPGRARRGSLERRGDKGEERTSRTYYFALLNAEDVAFDKEVTLKVRTLLDAGVIEEAELLDAPRSAGTKAFVRDQDGGGRTWTATLARVRPLDAIAAVVRTNGLEGNVEFSWEPKGQKGDRVHVGEESISIFQVTGQALIGTGLACATYALPTYFGLDVPLLGKLGPFEARDSYVVSLIAVFSVFAYWICSRLKPDVPFGRRGWPNDSFGPESRVAGTETGDAAAMPKPNDMTETGTPAEDWGSTAAAAARG